MGVAPHSLQATGAAIGAVRHLVKLLITAAGLDNDFVPLRMGMEQDQASRLPGQPGSDHNVAQGVEEL